MSPLIGALTREVKSFIVLTTYKKTPVIACPACAEKKMMDARFITVMAGWWGLPHGVISTMHALICSVIDGCKREEQSDCILTAFVIQHLGEIGANLDNEASLVELIRRANYYSHS